MPNRRSVNLRKPIDYVRRSGFETLGASPSYRERSGAGEELERSFLSLCVAHSVRAPEFEPSRMSSFLSVGRPVPSLCDLNTFSRGDLRTGRESADVMQQ